MGAQIERIETQIQAAQQALKRMKNMANSKQILNTQQNLQRLERHIEDFNRDIRDVDHSCPECGGRSTVVRTRQNINDHEGLAARLLPPKPGNYINWHSLKTF